MVKDNEEPCGAGDTSPKEGGAKRKLRNLVLCFAGLFLFCNVSRNARYREPDPIVNVIDKYSKARSVN
jgi:hypothetical protein